MIQRTPTTVVRSETLMDVAFDIYSEEAVGSGIDVDKADLIFASTPFRLLPEAQRPLYAEIAQTRRRPHRAPQRGRLHD